MATSRTINMPKTETAVAVLQVRVDNLTGDISEIKADIKELTVSIAKNNTDTNILLKEMKEASFTAHKSMADKLASQIGSLEKWRWMMMGAGVGLGALGFKTLAAFLGM